MQKLIVLVVLIVLMGCCKVPGICENKTITINNTINKTIEIPCNLTCPNDDRLELIRRLKYLEGQQNKWIINETECMVHNKTEEDLVNCENKIDMHKRDIEELEDDLEICEEGFCEFNSSWC